MIGGKIKVMVICRHACRIKRTFMQAKHLVIVYKQEF